MASIFATERNPLSGGNGKHSRSDSLHPELFISCKHTRTGHRSIFRLLDEETEKVNQLQKATTLQDIKNVFSGHSYGKEDDS